MCLACCLYAAAAQAQIYTCTGPDGTRIFSDQKCGPDAKVVPGITTKPRSNKPEATPSRPQRTRRPPEELERLLEACNGGDMKACTEWTHGGGPDYLREQEKQAALECEKGSLADCERRYCMDGITEECRRKVLAVAKVTGDTWYLRNQRSIAQGGVAYDIRCVVEGVRVIRDATVECAGLAGPARCALTRTGERFARLDQAAAAFCASR